MCTRTRVHALVPSTTAVRGTLPGSPGHAGKHDWRVLRSTSGLLCLRRGSGAKESPHVLTLWFPVHSVPHAQKQGTKSSHAFAHTRVHTAALRRVQKGMLDLVCCGCHEAAMTRSLNHLHAGPRKTMGTRRRRTCWRRGVVSRISSISAWTRSRQRKRSPTTGGSSRWCLPCSVLPLLLY